MSADEPADLDTLTRSLPDTARSQVAAASDCAVGLTIAWHAEAARVGDRCVLRPGTTEVSRTLTAFAGPGGEAPIGDRYLSRSPIALTRVGDGVTIDPRDQAVIVDGAPLAAPRRFDRDALDRGVVIELASRVLLLLGWVPTGAPDSDALGLRGDSVAIRRLRREIGRAAAIDAAVLIRGESGTGKELVAAALHTAGPRARGPYRVVNMAAIPPSTAAAQLFGHARGAFTGADTDSVGYFGDAAGGTLFLDEIGELPAELQPMLLRALESGEIQPVGARRTRRVDVRLVTATDASLEAAVDAGTFRLPLLYRLAGVEIRVPTLRARRDDIPRLLVHFLHAAFEAIGAPDRLDPPPADGVMWLGVDVVAALVRHRWPGNVRELINAARQIALAAHARRRVRLAEIPALARMETSPAPAPASRTVDADAGPPSDAEMLAALEEHRWSVNAAARALGTAKINVYRYIDRSPRLRKAGEIPDDEVRAVHAACGGDLDAMSARLEVSRRALTYRLKQIEGL